jgi:hypothetical protein
VQFFRVQYKSAEDDDHLDILLDEFPNARAALAAFNAFEAKTQCGGKRFEFYKGEKVQDWTLVGDDGISFDLIEV